MNELTAHRQSDLSAQPVQIRSSDLRRQCASHKNRKPCFICGRHKSVTEAHHTITLKEISQLLMSWGSLPEPPVVWLCPNCHAYAHNYRCVDPSDLEPGILEKIFDIQQIGEDFLSQYAEVEIDQSRQEGGKQSERP